METICHWEMGDNYFAWIFALMQRKGLLPLKEVHDIQTYARACFELGESLFVTEESARILRKAPRWGSHAQDLTKTEAGAELRSPHRYPTPTKSLLMI